MFWVVWTDWTDWKDSTELGRLGRVDCAGDGRGEKRTGDRRHEAGDRRQEIGDGDSRQETEDEGSSRRRDVMKTKNTRQKTGERLTERCDKR